jgi:hypothetical protein
MMVNIIKMRIYKDDNDKNMKIIYFNLFLIELRINNKYDLIFLYILSY